MKRKFTKLMAALALLVFIAPSMVAWGQTTVTQTSFSAITGNVNNDTHVTYASHKGGASTAPGVYNNEIRLYQGTTSSVGGYIVLGVSEGYVITSATIGSSVNTTAGYKLTETDPGDTTPTSFDVNDYSLNANEEYTVSGISTRFITFGCFGTDKNHRLYVNKISVTYQSTSGGNTPSLSVNPASVAFGEKAINPTIPYTETFTVTYGNLTENLSVSVGSGLTGVSVDPTTISKDGNGTQQVTVSYNPTAVGSISGNITVSNTADNVSATVAVTGSAYDPATIVYYTKIEENQTDWSGVYIVTYAGTSSYEALTGVANNLGTHASVSVSNGQIISNSTVDAYAVTISKTTGDNYSMQIGGQYLYAQASNNLYAADNFTTGSCEWTIAWDETSELVQITNVSQSTRRLQYNSGSPRFACYTGSQKDLTLFKYQGVVVLPLSAPVVTLEAGDQTITPTWEAVANASSYTLQWSTNEGFTEEYTTEITNATSGTAITGLTNGDTYFVRVMAIGDGTNFSNSNWSAVVSAEPTAIVVATPTFSVEGITTGIDNEYVEVASVTITAPDYNTHYIYYTTDGTDPDDSSEAYDGTPIDIIETTTIKAIAYDAELNESEIGSITVAIVETTPIATICAAEDDDNIYYITEGIITYKRNTSNMFIEDENAGILLYGSNSNYAVGDKVVVKGTKTSYQTKPELKNLTILGKYSSNNTLPKSEITVAQAATDDYLYRRVQLTQVLVGATESNLTPLSQGENSISVYQIPAIENVTEEGYYLKTVIGVVAYYSSDYQMYVAADDITIYDIDASSNNTELGTVTTNGYMVVATPAEGIEYANPAYVAESDANYTVTQDGNNFQVVTDGDVMIEIQFAAAEPCHIVYHVNGTVNSTLLPATVAQNAAIGTLPTVEGIGGFTFAGWSTSETEINIIDATYVVSGETLDLYAVYAETITGTSTTAYQKVSSISEGQYLIVYEGGNVAFDGSLEELDVASNTIDIEINESVIVSDQTTDASIFTIATIEGGYSIQSASGYYIGQTSDANGMKTSNETAYVNTINISNGNADIISGGAYMRYNSNSGQERFRYFKSGTYTSQKAIQLYKKETTTPETTTYYTSVGTTTLTINGYTSDETKDGYYLIASPVTVNPAGNGMTTGDFDLYYFDEGQEQEWRNYEATTFNLVPGKGYLYAKKATTETPTYTFELTGTPYNNQPITLSKSESGDFAGWNLVGNPFGEAAYITKSYYRMNTDHNEVIGGSGAINSMEGVFVIADQDGEQLTFSTTAPTAPEEDVVVNLNSSRGTTIDRAIVRFDNGRQLPKFQLNPNSTKLYIPQGNKDYAIVRSAAEAEMPVSFKASENGTYTLAVEAENVEMNYLHLIDNLTGMDVDLLQTPSYTFEAKTNDYTSRFRLIFKASSTSSEANETFAYYNGSNWTVSNLGEATLQVVDVTGRTVSSETINGNATISLNQTPGVYMLRLVNGNSVKVQKVVVR